MGTYEDLLADLLEQKTTPDRTGTGTRRLFNEEITYNLKEGFPLLTTKKVAWKSAFAETLWFISGSTDRRDLQMYQHGNFDERRFDIWKGNCLDRSCNDNEHRFNGYSLGNMYGAYWRNYPNSRTSTGRYYINETLLKLNKDSYTTDFGATDIFCPVYSDGGDNYVEVSVSDGSRYTSLRQHIIGIFESIVDSNNDNGRIKIDENLLDQNGFLEEMMSVDGYQDVVDEYNEVKNVPYSNFKFYLNFHHNIVSRNTMSFSIGKPKTKYIDQLQNCINLIKTDPTSRRIIMDSWNPRTTENAVLAICHPFVQFFVDGDDLNMFVLIRSNDFFLGHPFNVAGYALLLEIVAKECGLTANDLVIQMNDVHLYENHVDQAKEQLSREPYKWCRIELADNKSFDEYTLDDINVIDYVSHDTIKAEMAV